MLNWFADGFTVNFPMRRAWLLRSALPLGMLSCMSAAMADVDDHRRAGDVLRFAMPAGVVAYELWRGDTVGAWQFGKSWAVTLGATEALKRATHVERLDRSNDESFPSGHASHAFARRRHGMRHPWGRCLAVEHRSSVPLTSARRATSQVSPRSATTSYAHPETG
jgi:hypothetical protein